jgi:hypothetical protein
MTKIEGIQAPIFKGDPRLPENDIDVWWQEMLSEVQPPSGRPHLYGSDAGLCARKNVFYSQNTWVPFQMTGATRAYMAVGVALENMLAERMAKAGRLVKQDTWIPLMPELKIRGKIDLIGYDVLDRLSLFEIKSCGKLPEAPNVQHLAQIQMYCAVTGIESAWLTYISRNVQANYGPKVDIRSFRVDTSAATLKKRLYTAALSELSIQEGSVPAIENDFRKTLECRYCPFLDFCWVGEPRYGSLPPDSPLDLMHVDREIVLRNKAYGISNKLYQDRYFRAFSFLEEMLIKDKERIIEKLS